MSWIDRHGVRHSGPRPSGYRYAGAHPPRPHRGPPVRRGPPAEDRAAVIQQQNDMSNALREIFPGEQTPVLNPDGIAGTATNGVSTALTNFFNTILEGRDPPLPPNASLGDRAAAVTAMVQNAATREEALRRIEAARGPLRTEIGMLGTPRNGFTAAGNQFMNAPTTSPTAAPITTGPRSGPSAPPEADPAASFAGPVGEVRYNNPTVVSQVAPTSLPFRPN